MKLARLSPIALAVSGAIVLSACGGGGSGSSSSGTAAPASTSITVTPSLGKFSTACNVEVRKSTGELLGSAPVASNGTAACTMGACAVGACNTGFANCDNAAGNGCESNTTSSVAHCGASRNGCPSQKKEAGLEDVDFEVTENAIRTLIHHYTKESGVRNLERELGSICPKIARQVLIDGKHAAEGEAPKEYRVAAKNVPQYLGIPKYHSTKTSEHDEIGLTNGLAYTQYGGTILECEVTVVPGKGKLVITGLLEKGMQESAQAAMSYIRSRQQMLGLEEDFHSKVDVHVHFPEFVPKDGPSAGVTIATSIASALLRIPVRRTVAMTGEITLRGRVMPIGGFRPREVDAAGQFFVRRTSVSAQPADQLAKGQRRELKSRRRRRAPGPGSTNCHFSTTRQSAWVEAASPGRVQWNLILLAGLARGKRAAQDFALSMTEAQRGAGVEIG